MRFERLADIDLNALGDVLAKTRDALALGETTASATKRAKPATSAKLTKRAKKKTSRR